MGQEILYCVRCGERVTAADLKKGAAKSGNRAACPACAVEMRKEAGAAPRKAARPRKPATRRTTGTIRKVASEEPLPEPTKKKGLLIPVAAGGGAFVLVLLLLLLFSGNGDDPAIEDPGPVALEPPPAADAPAEEKKDPEPAPPPVAARFQGDLDLLERELSVPLRREDYRLVVQLLKRAHGRKPEADWKILVEERIRNLEGEVASKFAELKKGAEASKARGAEGGVETIRRKVEGWGLDAYVEEFSKAFPPKVVRPPAPAVTAKPPDPPKVEPKPASKPEPEPRERSAAAKAYLEQWKGAMVHAAARRYGLARGAIEEAGKGATEPRVRRECEEDLEDLAQVEALRKDAQDAFGALPPEREIAIGYRDPQGLPAEMKGEVVASSRGWVEVRREGVSRNSFVFFSELDAATLARLGAGTQRRRAAALLCLLEGNAEAAKKYEADVPDKYREFDETAKDRVPGKDASAAIFEREARITYILAQREYGDMETMGAAIDKYKALLRDFPGASIVVKNMDAITKRSKAGLEYDLGPAHFSSEGTFGSTEHEEVGPCLTSTQDTAPSQARENFVEWSFYRRPGVDYRCWLLAGACCRETFSMYHQMTGLETNHPKNRRQKLQVEPGSAFALPLKFRTSGLRSTHESHGGEKEPAKWQWVEIDLPRNEEGGVTTIRVMTHHKGFSVARALVSSTLRVPPKLEVIKAKKPDPPPAGRAATAKDPSLVLWWSFDTSAGGAVADLSGRKHDGTLEGGASLGAGGSPAGGSGLKLDGKGSFAKAAHAADLDMGRDDFTVAAWVKCGSDKSMRLFNKYKGNAGWIIDVHSKASSQKQSGSFRAKVGGKQVARANCLEVGQWQHLAVVVDRKGNALHLYVDGKAGSAKDLGNLDRSLDVDAPFGVGNIPAQGGKTFHGEIDDLRVYRRALSAKEIRAIAAAKGR